MKKTTRIVCTTLLISLGFIIYINVFVRNTGKVHIVNYGQYVFNEYQSRGVFTKRDICIEQHPNKPGDKVLVMYNSDHISMEEELIQDYHSLNSQYPGWPVFHRKGPIPKQHAIMDHPAYFMITTCEGNLHHIIDDSLLGLYGLLKATGRLGKPKLSQVFTTSCKSTESSSCRSYTRYLDLVLKLGVLPHTYGCISQYPESNVCFRHAGFGFLDSDKKQFYRYVTSQFGLTEESCSGTGILLVDRANRRVLNMPELEQATRALGLTNTRVERVDFADLSVEEQIRKVYCSHIMVGVQGAGLQWIYFLPDHSAILEIGWKRWRSKYVDRGRSVGVKGRFIDATENITVNWPVYQNHNKKLGTLSEENKTAILNDKTLKFSANPYKFADTHIGVNVYLSHLKNLIGQLQGIGVIF